MYCADIKIKGAKNRMCVTKSTVYLMSLKTLRNTLYTGIKGRITFIVIFCRGRFPIKCINQEYLCSVLYSII